MKQVEIFTDGACKGNPGPGGWAALLRMERHEKEHDEVMSGVKWGMREMLKARKEEQDGIVAQLVEQVDAWREAYDEVVVQGYATADELEG